MAAAPLSARESVNRRLQQAGGGVVMPKREVNPLLAKDDIGKAKPTAYELPGEHFAYGRPGNHDVEGAREVSMCWVGHKPSAARDAGVPDFLSIHKRATAAKITNPRDLRHFRTETGQAPGTPRSASVGRPTPRGPTIPPKDVVPSDVIPGFTYGRKVRPSTPIQHVISYRWAEKSEQELQRFYNELREDQEVAKTHVRRIPLTSASRGHASTAKKALLHKEEATELFKIKRFNRTGPKVKTGHRSRVNDILNDLGASASVACSDSASVGGGDQRLVEPEEWGQVEAGDAYGGDFQPLGE